jgi:hypothetical protein
MRNNSEQNISSSTSSSSSSSLTKTMNISKYLGDSNLILNIFFIFFIIVLIILIIKTTYYIYVADCEKVNLADYLFSFKIDPCDKKSKDIVRTITREKEVFHISDQIYTYEEAKCKCKNYGGRLATKTEMIKAYNEGANWCTYGWCEGGFAFFPVQSDYYEMLQLTSNQNKYCGTPGLNGGVFDPNLRFGINCYGIKPKGTFIPVDTDILNEDKDLCELDNVKERVEAKGSDNITSFSNSKWSLYD